ncbi:zinc finger HIT domain-containing protein 2 [Cotesia glomerata]|uniref:zinc finger HIT domain-containing protein 2 n=1 Tax=Cotesia glomerata TaxID=32391 RepID=UPI001D02D17D|nr:zinc finger HIT domain-containing protein 2 [Cotesia glomerata]
MDLSEPDQNLCQLCNSAQGKYTCPRCTKRYCSSECYKSKIHVECSEEFYQECVKAELKSKINNPDDTAKMINILKRHQESLNNEKFTDDYDDEEDEDNSLNLDESFDVVDSDDDDEIPDLADRIKNIDMNNPDDLWAALTDTERQEFEATIYNKETDKLLPQWVPWWSRVDTKLVTEVDDSLDFIKKECPDLIEIHPINGIDKASPLLSHNLVNIVVAYVIMVLHYNGEYQESFRESTEIFLQLNDIIGGDKVFNDDKLAAQAVIEKSVECDILPENGENLVITCVNKIIQGPINDKTYYLKAVLSDLYVLIDKLNIDSTNASKSNKSTLPKKFQINYFKCCKLTKKHLQLYLKKIQYYLAWVDKFGARMSKLNFD